VSRVMGENSLISSGNNNFRLHVIRSCTLKTAANLCATWRQANIFLSVCSVFELDDITKHIMTGPETLNVPLDFVSANIEGRGKTKLGSKSSK